MARSKALLFIFEGYCEFEISVAIAMLRTTHDLHTVAMTDKPCRSESGLNTLPDLTIQQGVLDDYDVLVIPGGDLAPIAEAEELFEWVAQFAERGKVIGAICSGAYVLAKANVLKNRPYTVTLAEEQRNFLGCFTEENFKYEPVVIHNHIITAQGHAFVEFGIKLNEMVRDVKPEQSDFYRGIRNAMMEKNIAQS
ncbi:DJ-1/PfpI family protein [Paenibacillus albiflavus]|uniref:DJ-1/PfpI family protein n=1 Tax=Paenibacillus albiflavus TaxID=2545760 RepID=UPI001405113C|nr:DJ-1/PfpI family protein [Paenibacillus albiflavus]